MRAVRAIALSALGALAACVPGAGSSGMGSGDASGSGSPLDAAVDAPKLMWVDAAMGSGSNLPCKNQATPPGDGRHFPGKHCLQCHTGQFSVAGTLYTNATGNTAFAGATITITDSAGETIDLVTNQNGNFYTMQPLQFPVLVMASACPSAVKMPLAVAATGASCNTCHAGGTNDQMHLP